MQLRQTYIRRRKMQKLLNQFNNFCYLRTSFDLKVQDMGQTGNQRDDQNCETKFIRGHKRLLVIELIQ